MESQVLLLCGYKGLYGRPGFLKDMMLPDLDALLRSAREPVFKSQGECRIAAFLDQCGVQYMYEAPVVVQHRDRQRLWYPDFKLPDLGVHIEYFGIEHDPAYDRVICDKMSTYAASGIETIAVFPYHLPHLPQYLTREFQEHANYQRHIANAIFFCNERHYRRRVNRG